MPGTEKDFASLVTIDNVFRGESAGFDGGDIGGDDTSIHEPGQQFPTALGGLDEVSPVTVKFFWKDAAQSLYLDVKNKRGYPMVVARHKRNTDRSIVAAPFVTFYGIVHEIKAPSHDSASSTEAVLEITMQVSDVK